MDSNIYFLPQKNIMLGYFNKYHVVNGKRTIGIFFRCNKIKVTFAQKEVKEKKRKYLILYIY